MFFEQAREQEEAKVNANKQDVVVGPLAGRIDCLIALHTRGDAAKLKRQRSLHVRAGPHAVGGRSAGAGAFPAGPHR